MELRFRHSWCLNLIPRSPKMHSMFLAFERCVRVEEHDDDAVGGWVEDSFQDGMMNGLKCNYSKVIHENEV